MPDNNINSLMDLMRQPGAPPMGMFAQAAARNIPTDAAPSLIASYPQGYGAAFADWMQQQAQQPRMYGTSDPDYGYYSQGGGWGGAAPPPDVASYFNQGQPRIDDPRQVAAEGGITLGQLAGGMFPRDVSGYAYPSDRGGFFRMEDLFGLTGRDVPHETGGGATYRQGATPVPSIGGYGQQLPSTNNWRLLGHGPGWIMRNGFLINTRDPGVRFGSPAGADVMGVIGEGGMGVISRSAVGTGGWFGAPNTWRGLSGWPGSSFTPDRWPLANV